MRAAIPPPPRNARVLSPEDAAAPRLRSGCRRALHRDAQLHPGPARRLLHHAEQCHSRGRGRAAKTSAPSGNGWSTSLRPFFRGEAALFLVNCTLDVFRHAAASPPTLDFERPEKSDHGCREGGCTRKPPTKPSEETMASTNNYPKLHNAMWPGIVGKGAPRRRADHPARHAADAHRQRRGRRREVRRRRSLRRRRPHFDIDSDKDAVKRIADQIAGYGLKVGSFVAPIWGGAGGGSAMGDADDRKRFLDAGAEGLRHRPADARDGHPPDRRRPHRLLDRRRGLGQGSGGQHQADRRDLPRGRQDRRRTTASSSSPRARSAGAACIPGART